MKLHPLPPDAKCPYCCKGGLEFVRDRFQGDLYRCTAATPCKGLSLHHRRDRGSCRVSAVTTIGSLMSWTECPGKEPAPKEEITEEYLPTRQAAERLRVSTRIVIRLLAKGKLSGTKIGFRWQIPAAMLRGYSKTASVTRRTTRN